MNYLVLSVFTILFVVNESSFVLGKPNRFDVSKPAPSTQSTPPVDTGDDKGNLLDKRFLRSSEVTATSNHTKNEERAFGLRPSTLAELEPKAFARYFATNQWLKVEMKPRAAFHTLRLNEEGVKLEGNPLFLRWLEYVKSYQAGPDGHRFTTLDFYDLLASATSKAEMTSLIGSLKKTPGMENLAQMLEEMAGVSPLVYGDVWKRYAKLHAANLGDRKR
ncbi:unnamed protein product [Phytophthora fragariaefolia]|uniref:Unnamed protein product n=1 Tax=Phytophthora fragariaefolia TaxID=1490495 RepID=A0A9W6XMD3_9STRA|nr:unnamed protein product [Phytophthora fragariaefolia]